MCGWVGVLNSLLRDHTGSAQAQLLGSKMDSLDSLRITFRHPDKPPFLAFNKLVTLVKTSRIHS